MTQSENRTGNKIEKWRFNAFLLVIGGIMLLYVSQLFTYQIVEGEDWLADAEQNRTEEVSLLTQRGVIYDKNGIIIARNVASYNVAITPALLPDDEGDIEQIIRDLSQLTNTPVSFDDDPEAPNILIECGDNLGITEMVDIGFSFEPYSPVFIECDIERGRALAIMEKAADWPGVSIQIEPVRDYPTGDLTSTFIGFLGPIPENTALELRELGFLANRDKTGYGGLELYFDELLRGFPGKRVVEVDVAGAELRDIEGVQQPIDGLNLVLTIDLRYQQAVNAIVEREINFWNTYFYGNSGQIRISSGAAMAMNPTTGEVLAMVSWPSYENNRFAEFIPAYYYEQLITDSRNPLLNHAVGAELPAGSVFKIVTAVGALNEGVVTPNQRIKTPGLITIANVYSPNDPGASKEFVDWNRAGFGELDFYGGVANSSNVYFYKIGGGYENEVPDGGLGICRLGTYAEAMGFNQLLGIELPDETDGLIPDPTWKRINQGENWSTGDTYIASVGQGFMISTPMQILVSASTVANNGKLMRPTIVHHVEDGDGYVIPIVMDQFGNILESRYDLQGRVVSKVFNVDGDQIDFIVLDENGELYDQHYTEEGSIDGQVYSKNGNPIRPTLISPFVPDMKWDLTEDNLIETFSNPSGIGSCKSTGEFRTVEPWVFTALQQGMRMAATEGTLSKEDVLFGNFPIPVAGKTGTAEYCDAVALSKNLCIPGNWPTHSWTVAYAPYGNPEIAVVSFMYNGGEGASVAGPVVKQMIEAYFELKTIDAALGAP